MSSTLATSVASSFVLTSSSASITFHSPKQQEDVALKAHIASICFKCFRCFILHVDVAKVDRDIAYVASVYFKFFIYFFILCCQYVYLDVAYVSHIYWKRFICMLHMLCNGFSSVSVFLQVFQNACFKCFICLRTYIANILFRCFISRSGVAFPSSPSPASPRCLLLLAPAGIRYPLSLFSMLVMFGAARTLRGHMKQPRK
jgi:hypothetical protein